MADTDNKNLKQISQDISNIYTIELANIFSSLHSVAIENVNKDVSNYTIINTALDGVGKDAKFSGPGQHIVMAVPTSDEIKKEDALLAIKTYVQWFSGPENSKKLTIDDIKPQFANLTEEDKQKADKKAKDDKEKSKEKSKEKDTATESNNIINKFLSMLFESTYEEDLELAKQNNQKIAGYFIEYEVEIGNNRGSSLDSAWKKIGKQVASMFDGLSLNVFRGKTSVASLNIGDARKALSGKIDANKLINAVQASFKANFPGLDSFDVNVLDSKTIINTLKNRLAVDVKSALKKVQNALCIKVNKNSKSYELISKQEIADTVTKSMKSSDKIFGKNKNEISKNNVYIINNYSDNKDQTNNNQTKEKVESIIIQKKLLSKIFENVIFVSNNLFTEALETDTNEEEFQKELDKLADFVNSDKFKYFVDKDKDTLDEKFAKVIAILKTAKNKKESNKLIKYVNSEHKDNPKKSKLKILKQFTANAIETANKLYDEKETSDRISNKLKKPLKILKFLIIHYCIKQLIDKKLLNDKDIEKAVNNFNLPTNQNTLDEIYKISANKKNIKEQEEAVTLDEKEIKNFSSGYKLSDIEKLQSEVNARKDGSIASKAFKDLLFELEKTVKDFPTDKKLDLKSIAKSIPGTEELTISDLRVGNQNLWNQGPGVVLKIIDNVKEQQKNLKDVQSTLDKNKTQWDCYIIPMENLDFTEAKETAEKNKA